MFWFKKKKLNIDEANLGVVEDPRPNKEKKCDYRAEEVLSFAPVEWKEKSESEWRKYPTFNQDGSSSCLAQSEAKYLGIENFLEEGKFVHFSARDVYSRRSNYPGKGMFFQNALEIGHKFGATFEQLMPSQGLNETVMNMSEDRTPLTEIVAKPGRGGNYLILPRNIEEIASVIEPRGKPIVLGVRFGPYEWTKKVPEMRGTNIPYGHGIVGIEALLHKGKKAILIDDSARPETGFDGRRILTEDWFKEGRIIWAGYHQFLSNTGIETKPSYHFTRDLKYGDKNEEVVWLQKCLCFKKYFPSEVNFTGYFGGITLKGVKLYQELNKEKISKYVGYQISCTGFVGKGTRYILNKEFGS